jgi:hypothetical protein
VAGHPEGAEAAAQASATIRAVTSLDRRARTEPRPPSRRRPAAAERRGSSALRRRVALRPPAARLRTIAGLLACLLLAACGSHDHKPKTITVATARASGRHATATASGIANRPVAVAVRASAAPKQRVVVTWGLSCPQTDRGKDKGTGGTYVATPPNVRALRLPRRTIAFCAIRAEAQLRRSGRVKVTLLASER